MHEHEKTFSYHCGIQVIIIIIDGLERLAILKPGDSSPRLLILSGIKDFM
jgi:hypothetical protein